MQLIVIKCVNKTQDGRPCKTGDDLAKFWGENAFYLAVRNSYLDQTNFSDPVK